MKTFILSLLVIFSLHSYSQTINTDSLPGDDHRLFSQNPEITTNEALEFVLVSYQRKDSIYRKITFLLCEEKSWLAEQKNSLPWCESATNKKECYDSFYSAENDSVELSTVLVESDNFLWEIDYRLWQCDYSLVDSSYIKQGKEIKFYTISELPENYCLSITSLIAYVGFWKNGRKDGEWMYYSIEGELLKTENYNNGELLLIE